MTNCALQATPVVRDLILPFGGRDNEATAGADPMEVLALILDRFRLRACPSSRLVPAAIAGGTLG